MLEIKNISELLILFEKNQYPIAWGISIVLVVFLIWRKFTTTEYITAGKAAFDQLNALCDQLQEENRNFTNDIKIINEHLDQCLLTNKKMKEEFEYLKNKINLTIN